MDKHSYQKNYPLVMIILRRCLLLALGAITTVTVACGGDSTGPVTGPPPPPNAAIQVIEGDDQAALAGTPVSQPIRIRVEDAQGRGVANQIVSFTVPEGGGSVAQNRATTGADGTVDVPSWTLGKYDLPQTVRASLLANPGVAANIAASVATQYTIDIVFIAGGAGLHGAAFDNAKARLQAAIVGALPPVTVENLDVEACFRGFEPFAGLRHTGTIPGLVIYAYVAPIDGPFGVLGFAGACYARDDTHGWGAPLLGIMIFDSDDLDRLSGFLDDLVMHEMLHVVGFNDFFWSRRGLVADQGTPQWSFTGEQARNECALISGGSTLCNPFVPIEHLGGPGTRGSHWRECALPTLGTELMTGFLNSAPAGNPLSAVTIASLGDLGYQVNLAAADPFVVPEQTPLATQGCQPGGGAGSSVISRMRLLEPIAAVDRHGRVIPFKESGLPLVEDAR